MNYQNEINKLNEKIKSNPNDEKNYHDRAIIYLCQKNTEKAFDDCSLAIKLNPNYFEAYSIKSIINKTFKKDFKAATSDAKKALDIVNKGLIDYEFYIKRGLIKKELLNDYDNAIQDFTNAIELNPDKPFAYFNRGQTKHIQKHYNNAMDDYNKVIDIDSSNEQFFYYRGLLYKDLYKYEEAIKDFNKAIILNPKYIEAYYDRAISKQEIQNYEGAIEDYNYIISKNSKDEKAYIKCADIKNIYLNDYQGAIEILNEALKINSDFIDTRYKKANIERKLNNYKSAIEDYNYLISKNSKDEKAYLNRTYTKEKIGNYTGAINDLNEIIKINPKDLKNYILRALLKDGIEDYTGAKKDINKSNTTEMREYVLDFYDILNNYENYIKYTEENQNNILKKGLFKSCFSLQRLGLEDYNKVIDFAPDNSNAYYLKASNELYFKNIEKALDNCNKAIFLFSDSNKKSANLKSTSSDPLNRITINDYYRLRAEIREELKDYNGAIEDFNIIIESEPKEFNNYRKRGNLKYEIKDLKGALEDFEQTIELYKVKNNKYTLYDCEKIIEKIKKEMQEQEE